MKKIMIMAAGTGGHIFPGLSIASEAKKNGLDVSWLGTSGGMENSIVHKHGIPIDVICFSGIRGKGIGRAIRGFIELISGVFSSIKYIRSSKPDVVVGMGGYVTIPGGIAAKVLGVPLVLVNADSTLLLSNKVLAPIASQICFGFDSSSPGNDIQGVVTGNPVREDISGLLPPYMRYGSRKGSLRMLVVGGSLGARILNDVIPKAMSLLPLEMRPEITHQTGSGNRSEVLKSYDAAGVKANVVEFIDDMSDQYKNADIVVCRAGAITLSELTCAGVASILVPLIASTTVHQEANAEWLAERGGALHLPQKDFSPESLARILASKNRSYFQSLAIEAYKYRRTHAAKSIVEILEAASK